MNYAIKTLSQLRPILLGFRKSAGLTQTAVAELLDITQQSYAQMEANPASASVERLFKVLRFLNVELRLSREPSASSNELAQTDTSKLQRRVPAARKAKSPSASICSDRTQKTSSSRLPPKIITTRKKRENW